MDGSPHRSDPASSGSSTATGTAQDASTFSHRLLKTVPGTSVGGPGSLLVHGIPARRPARRALRRSGRRNQPSSRELLARRLAPCTPVQEHSRRRTDPVRTCAPTGRSATRRSGSAAREPRDEVQSRIDPVLQARRQNRREALGPIDSAAVEPHVLGSLGSHGAHGDFGHDVAGASSSNGCTPAMNR